MANARLKLAREKARKRVRHDVESQAESVPEAPVAKKRARSQTRVRKEPTSDGDDPELCTPEALVARKWEVEQRLQDLTMGRTLVRVDEPGVDANARRMERAHRDFLLQEMEWMAADFAQERKWRVKSARSLALSVASHHKTKAARLLRQDKMEQERRRRLAARIGRDVKKFWGKIDKIIGFKVKLQADELRKAAMDRQLRNLVSQTERYASALATTFYDVQADGEREGEGGGGDQTEPCMQGCDKEEVTEDTAISDSDSDFDGTSAVGEDDDETTIAAEEAQARHRRRHGDEDEEDEIALLTMENELSIEELRRRYMVLAETKNVSGAGQIEMEQAEGGSDGEAQTGVAEEEMEDGDSDFSGGGDDEADDERTMEIDEQGISREEVTDEVARLQEESLMSLDELRARYTLMMGGGEGVISEDETAEDMDTRNENNEESEDFDEEYHPSAADKEEVDDERTIEHAERMEFTRVEVDEEVSMLQEESELSIEELRARYGLLSESFSNDGHILDYKIEEDGENQKDKEDEVEQSSTVVSLNSDGQREDYEKAENVSTKGIQQSSSLTQGINSDSSRALISTPTASSSTGFSGSSVPRLFQRSYLLSSRLSLRAYQQAGVNWLISLCDKRINGILADEMGLGKTIQTIALLAHLATARCIWGPHLIVVPTSCLLNWEMELKRWCPALKVLTYFGSAKRRKSLRHGWSKPNAFQVCITSYQLVVQDAHCFKRKKWFYLILDEAHHIKNFRSLRWQTLLSFHAQRRLLLTGTPLQNHLLELWALMHFLMPHVFASRQEFAYWFQSPLGAMVEGERAVSDTLVAQLHGIIRPFVLRRLKKDVAKQLPAKVEHVVVCALSKRQRLLYEDFISRSSTRRALYGRGGGAGVNFMSMMNVLMQLRKVCNHPDLFEPRPIASPLDITPITFSVPTCCGYLVDPLEWTSSSSQSSSFSASTLAWWPSALRLPNQEFNGCERNTSVRVRQLLCEYDDVAMVRCKVEGEGEREERKAVEGRGDVLRRFLRLAEKRREYWRERRTAQHKHHHVMATLHEPMFGADLLRVCMMPVFISPAMQVHVDRRGDLEQKHGSIDKSLSAAPSSRQREWSKRCDALQSIVLDPEERIHTLEPVLRRAVCVVPKARAPPPRLEYGGRGWMSTASSTINNSDGDFCYDHVPLSLWRKRRLDWQTATRVVPVARRCLAPYEDTFKRTQLYFPDKRLLQFDCGKLQQLDRLLRTLKRGQHRCLIFTQMSAMLNILESFLNIHGHTYFRLDGSTKVERRQQLMDRFNKDEKVFCFILSTRSGGLGINLTGADTVIFYDSDWNPAMDAQAQDRAHRIGQTRDVHIYRLVSEHTVEENILKKAQQKRHLDALVMAEGRFTTEFFSKTNLRELLVGDEHEVGGASIEEVDNDDKVEVVGEDGAKEDDDSVSLDAIEHAMAELEDADDVAAMHGARAEFLSEQREFDDEETGKDRKDGAVSVSSVEGSGDGSRASTPSATPVPMQMLDEVGENDEDGDDRSSVTESQVSITVESGDDEEDSEVAITSRQYRGNTSIRKTSGNSERQDEDEDGGEDEVKDGGEDNGNDAESEDDAITSDDNEVSGGSSDSDDDEMGEEDLNEQDEFEARSRGGSHKRIHDEVTGSRLRGSNRAKLNEAVPNQLKPLQPHQLEQQRRAHERAKEREREREEERKLQAWKDSVSSLQHFEDSLNAVDRYALHFREQIDPLYAYAPLTAALIVSDGQSSEEQQRLLEQQEEQAMRVNLEAVEAQKVVEERALLADGELIVGLSPSLVDDQDKGLREPEIEGVDEAREHMRDIDTDEIFYKRERGLVHYERRRRQLSGEAWQVLACAVTGHRFYFNSDTREATWNIPQSWIHREELAVAQSKRFAGLPVRVMRRLLGFLEPYPARWTVQQVCHSWYDAAQDPSLCIRISAGECHAANALARTNAPRYPDTETKTAGRLPKRDLATVLKMAPHGATVLFGSGVYEVHDVLEVTTPLRLLATADAHVELRMTSPRAQLRWTARGGELCGFHITRRHDIDQTSAIGAPVNSSVPEVVVEKLPPATLDPKLNISRATANETIPTPINPTASKTKEATLDKVIPAVTKKAPATVKATTTASALGWQHLLHITGGGRLRALYCDFDGNHQGNACVAVSGSSASQLVLQQSRVYHSGSGSGVLLLRGILVMHRNVVHQNAFAGVTVWMGDALLRHNVVESNRRFGIRLLYHANNVVIENNRVVDHPCGNMDVENSGRRFVVRWNDMVREEPPNLPHDHGTIHLRTSRVEERHAVVGKSGDSGKKNIKPPRKISTTPTTTPVIPNGGNVGAMPDTSTMAVTVTPSDDSRNNAIPGAITQAVLTTTLAAQKASHTSGIGSKPPYPAVPVSSNVKLPLVPAPVTMPSLALGPSAAVAPFAKLNPSGLVPSQLPPASIGAPSLTAALSHSTSAQATTPTLNPTTAASMALTPVTGPPKIRRKRKPKMEKVIVHGVLLALQDTCEKKNEKKVKKPRGPRQSKTLTSATSTESTPTATTEPPGQDVSMKVAPTESPVTATNDSLSESHASETVTQTPGDMKPAEAASGALKNGFASGSHVSTGTECAPKHANSNTADVEPGPEEPA